MGTPIRPIEIALAHARRGRCVFPIAITRGPAPDFKVRKTPLVKWSTEATCDEGEVLAQWQGRRGALAVGWRLPEGTAVVDVDDRVLFKSTGLVLPGTATQASISGRGYHALYTTDGRPVAQVTRQAEGFDTRVGGKGMVGLYALDSFAGEVAAAPDWMYGLRKASRAVTDDPISGRLDILALAGRLRWAGLDGDEIEAVLIGRLDDGRIYSEDPGDPWDDGHMTGIAQDIGSKASHDRDAPGPVLTLRSKSKHARRAQRGWPS